MSGRALTDADWADMRANLLAVFSVLVEWQCADDDACTDDCERVARR
jgi:hypothetical protein